MANFLAVILATALFCGVSNAQAWNATRGDACKTNNCVVPIPANQCNKQGFGNFNLVAPCGTFTYLPTDALVRLVDAALKCQQAGQICSQCSFLTVDAVRDILNNLSLPVDILAIDVGKVLVGGLQQSSCCSSQLGLTQCSVNEQNNSPCGTICNGYQNCASNPNNNGECCTLKCVN